MVDLIGFIVYFFIATLFLILIIKIRFLVYQNKKKYQMLKTCFLSFRSLLLLLFPLISFCLYLTNHDIYLPFILVGMFSMLFGVIISTQKIHIYNKLIIIGIKQVNVKDVKFNIKSNHMYIYYNNDCISVWLLTKRKEQVQKFMEEYYTEFEE